MSHQSEQAKACRAFLRERCDTEHWYREKDILDAGELRGFPRTYTRALLSWMCDRRRYLEGYFWRLNEVGHKTPKPAKVEKTKKATSPKRVAKVRLTPGKERQR